MSNIIKNLALLTNESENNLQEKFFEDLLQGYFGFDIINSSTHPLKDAFKLYCEMEYERIKEEEAENE